MAVGLGGAEAGEAAGEVVAGDIDVRGTAVAGVIGAGGAVGGTDGRGPIDPIAVSMADGDGRAMVMAMPVIHAAMAMAGVIHGPALIMAMDLVRQS